MSQASGYGCKIFGVLISLGFLLELPPEKIFREVLILVLVGIRLEADKTPKGTTPNQGLT